MTQSGQLEGGSALIAPTLPPPKPGEDMEAARLGRFIGMSPKQIERLTSLGMPCKRTVRGKLLYNTAECWAWWASYHAGQATSAPMAASLQDERAQLARAQRERVELQTATMRRDLLPFAEVKSLWHFSLSRLRTRLLAVPAKLAPTILLSDTPAKAQAQIGQALRECLEELADVPEQLGGEPGDGRPAAGVDVDPAAAAAVDDLAMGGHEPGA